MDRIELHQLGCKIKASARGPILDYIEGTLPLLVAASAAQASKSVKVEPANCPVCAERRRRKAKAQKDWRAKKR